MKNLTKFLTRVNTRDLTNNTQRVALKLLEANGSWIESSDLRRAVPSATARVRDLRKSEFGSLAVECATAAELHKAGGKNTFFYRINPRKLTVKQVANLLVSE